MEDDKKIINTEFGLEKRCSCCNEYWPLDKQFFNTHPHHKDGFSSWCNACRTEKQALRRANQKYFKYQRGEDSRGPYNKHYNYRNPNLLSLAIKMAFLDEVFNA